MLMPYIWQWKGVSRGIALPGRGTVVLLLGSAIFWRLGFGLGFIFLGLFGTSELRFWAQSSAKSLELGWVFINLGLLGTLFLRLGLYSLGSVWYFGIGVLGSQFCPFGFIVWSSVGIMISRYV